MTINKVKSFAKINLALRVTGKFSKLHKIESVVKFIELHDLITIKKINSKKHHISFNGNFLKENVYITAKEKIFLIAKSIIEFLIFFILPVHRKKHNKYLHEPLLGLADANTK